LIDDILPAYTSWNFLDEIEFPIIILSLIKIFGSSFIIESYLDINSVDASENNLSLELTLDYLGDFNALFLRVSISLKNDSFFLVYFLVTELVYFLSINPLNPFLMTGLGICHLTPDSLSVSGVLLIFLLDFTALCLKFKSSILQIESSF